MWNCLNRADVGTSSAVFLFFYIFFKAAPVAQHPEAVCVQTAALLSSSAASLTQNIWIVLRWN